VYDLAIKGGRIVDGTGSPWYVADLAVKDGRIARIGIVDGSEARKVLPAAGMVVAPGFVDIHSHADFVLPTATHMDVLGPLMLQGITTLVTGNCGLSPAPLTTENLPLLADYTAFFQSDGFCFEWGSMAEFLEALEDRGVGFNVIPLTSHGAVRIAVMGFAAGEPTSEQLARMQALVRQSMEEGAFGLSAGLIYAPGMYASTDELVAVTQPLREAHTSSRVMRGDRARRASNRPRRSSRSPAGPASPPSTRISRSSGNRIGGTSTASSSYKTRRGPMGWT
jgi:N-acyl-D-amino-acid deacylase